MPEQAERDAYEALACFAGLKAYLGASNISNSSRV